MSTPEDCPLIDEQGKLFKREGEYSSDRRKRDWLPFIGDAIVLVVMLATMLVGWGKLNEKVETLERQRLELKADVGSKFSELLRSIERLDDKVTILLKDSSNASASNNRK